MRCAAILPAGWSSIWLRLAAALPSLAVAVAASAANPTYDGWKPQAVRDEIRPQFSVEEHGGCDGEAALVIIADSRNGLDGYWAKTFEVEGNRYYRLRAFRKASGKNLPPQATLVRLLWLDKDGHAPFIPGKVVANANGDDGDWARAEFPVDRSTDANGWTEVSGTYLAPADAVRATVELRSRWVPDATVRWSRVSLTPTELPVARPVRLAAVRFLPNGGTTIHDNCEMFVPLIEEAARQKADLVVLPEYCLSKNLPGSLEQCSQPVPGPATNFFETLAAQHDLYLVVALFERDPDGRRIYNTAALIGPEGYIGKYRKVCLPREEYEKGVSPGSEFPVFDTRIGKVGMMICWDLQFPEVSRQLASAGAEIIACPIAGGNPLLAKARAIENQIYLVTSAYSDRPNWMTSGIWDPEGNLLAHTDAWGTVAVEEVDLGQPKRWWWVGTLKDRIARERPMPRRAED